ncbi:MULTISPECIES: helix-turn-helix transcriptional regulator [unclassified Streptomyces]|uniref:ArsR/SmtB family transcription factor n=1 Tax=unclassified Streptomyces TaxID=2593676 RepID=UPI00190A05A1|nr:MULTISPECIES: helix-turn-helix domain-containing protein [unclassified Streptomyces]MBK3567882.1 helix-turn-helix transcriptional regulator [Streptomyces sp. MBT62]MBK6016425.1 helix-turn-helix transcriptional regulator [Streptomyces sp. MBT53]
MLRIHFTEADLARTRLASEPDPLWETALSLHRLQTQRGRSAHAEWYRTTRARLADHGLEGVLRHLLLPLFPRTAYFPDFLTPAEGTHGLTAGLAALVDTPADRVRREVARFTSVAAPPWAPRLVERATRQDVADSLRRYHEVAVAPYRDRVLARVEADRSVRGRALLAGGADALLDGLGPQLRWEAPVLHVHYPPEDRDLRLDGRGLTLLPSYFCWGPPIALADSSLPPVLVYPVLREARPVAVDRPLGVLLGRTRAQVLRGITQGATTGELARLAGVSAPTVSQHITALRDAGLISSLRFGTSVLHTLTPLGAALLRGSGKPVSAVG